VNGGLPLSQRVGDLGEAEVEEPDEARETLGDALRLQQALLLQRGE
jgi:hypothetical protein